MNVSEFDTISIRKGVRQSDSLSPLLFVFIVFKDKILEICKWRTIKTVWKSEDNLALMLVLADKSVLIAYSNENIQKPVTE